MRKIILVNLVVIILFLTAVGVCFSASAVQVTSQKTQPEKIESAGTGLIRGTITNQNGRPIALVRVIAAGSPRDNATKLAITLTHLPFGGIGTYELPVPAGRYLFVRAAKLPLYLGAWAGPVTVKEGQVVTLDLSITYIGPQSTPVVFPSGQNIIFERFPNLLFR
jgi:hypothetical protein